MNRTPEENDQARVFQPFDFDKITQVVSSEFQIEESTILEGTPTYYLKWPQESKQAFLRLLSRLEELRFIAYLRKAE